MAQTCDTQVQITQADASICRISAVGLATDLTGLNISNDAANDFRVSAIIDSGSISGRCADGNQFHVSAVQGDAGLLRCSAFAAFSKTLLTAASAVNVKATAGMLHGLMVNTAGKTIQIADSVSFGSNVVATLDAPAAGTFFQYDCLLSAGLTISAVSAANLTVMYL